MLSVHANRPHPPHVTALFSDGAQSFMLFEGATLAELAGRIDVLGKTHDGSPIAVHVDAIDRRIPFTIKRGICALKERAGHPCD
jgi:hypothetical protein